MNSQFVFYFVVPLIFIAVITFLCVILLGVSFRHRKESGQIDIRDWSTTGGKVLSIRLDPHQPDAKHAGADFEPHVEYAYVVNEIEYLGKKVFPGESGGFTKKAAQEILNQYPLNTYVPVRYNPQSPSDSALHEQSRSMDYLNLAGWVFTGFGVIACCFTSFMAFIILGAVR